MNENVVLAAHHLSKKFSGRGGNFLALDDVSFELRKGEILGIIGQNGAGKSTLLKILSEVIPPTNGHVEYSGSILSILDIGTGFHADLSGHENIFLNASLLGMKKSETEKKLDEIIDFSGIREFIHEPVKTYSNGMYLRLALSIALFTSNEIILLDEVISVGDAEFRLKAMHMIRSQASQGRACIMISHDLNSVISLCDNCLLMEKGKIVFAGKASKAVNDYYESVYSRVKTGSRVLEHEVCRFVSMAPAKEAFYTDEPVILKIAFEVKKEEDIRVIARIRQYQNPVMTDSLAFRPEFEVRRLLPGPYEVELGIPANLLNGGSYFVDIIIANELVLFINYESAAKFSIRFRDWEAGKNWNSSNTSYPVRPICSWVIKPAGSQDQMLN